MNDKAYPTSRLSPGLGEKCSGTLPTNYQSLADKLVQHADCGLPADAELAHQLRFARKRLLCIVAVADCRPQRTSNI